LGAKESMENKYEGSPKRMSLKGDSAEFVNDERLNREPVKFYNILRCNVIKKIVAVIKLTINECHRNGFDD